MRHHRLIRPSLAFAHATALLAFSTLANAQFTNPVSNQLNYVGAAADLFGAAVAVDYRTAAIGAPEAGPSGQVSIYDYNADTDTWNIVQSITPAGLTAEARFGASVAFSRDVNGLGRLVVGAPDDQGVGRVHIYDDSSGVYAPIAASPLLPSAMNAVDFGESVATNGVEIVVGDPLAGNPAIGRATLFDASYVPTVLVPVVTPTGPAEFGASVDIDQDTIVIGAPGDQTGLGPNATNIGSAHVYVRTAGTFTALPGVLSDPVANPMVDRTRFGASVSTDADLIAVGAPASNLQTAMGGAAYAFDFQPLTNTYDAGAIVFDAAGPGALLGSAVAVRADRIVMGAPGINGVFLARRAGPNAWTVPGGPNVYFDEPAQIPGSPILADAGFALAFDTDFLIVGAPAGMAPFGASGAAFGYRMTRSDLQHIGFGADQSVIDGVQYDVPMNQCPCANNPVLGSFSGCINSSDPAQGGQLLGYGTGRLGAGDLRFEARGLPVGSGGVLFSGTGFQHAGQTNLVIGLAAVLSGDGLRCAFGDFARHGFRSTDANGTIGITNRGWGAPDSAIINLGPMVGTSRSFQLRYRDDPTMVCQTGINTTNAVWVTFTL